MDFLDKIIEICEKEVKEERDNIIQIILTILSSYTKNPQNLRILAPSGEGKTYLVNHVADLFPKENIMKLSNATPQSFKYLATRKVIEISPDTWQDYEIAMQPLEDALKKTKDVFEKKELKNQIQSYKERTYNMYDFENKIIIFLDSQSFALWESMKTSLSHDDEYIKGHTVNKNNKGSNITTKTVFKGFPAVIYCSAKDEINIDKTDEINTRFNTISIKGNQKKYKKMLHIQGLRTGLPTPLYEEKIISEEEIEMGCKNVELLIENILEYGQNKNPILNLYTDVISGQFKADAGFRVRQLAILLSNITITTLLNADQRPKIVIDGERYPITLKQDVQRANELTREPTNISLTKIQFFNQYIKPAIKTIGKEISTVNDVIVAATAREIAEWIVSEFSRTTDRKRLLETHLQPLVEHGYLEQMEDPTNRKQNLFFIPPRYQDEDAKLESTFIDISTIDDSCVIEFKEKYLDCRLEYQIIDKMGHEITFDELIKVVTSIDNECVKNTNEIDAIESSTDVDKTDED
ncbi:MAG: hypothetical protein H8E89_03115 [Candidatus Nitrosopelagicus sp.]|nr:hypothetical protein [Candidatus Nitrosopelagicus sp.]